MLLGTLGVVVHCTHTLVEHWAGRCATKRIARPWWRRAFVTILSFLVGNVCQNALQREISVVFGALGAVVCCPHLVAKRQAG